MNVTKKQRQAIRIALAGKSRSIQIGRSFNIAGFGTQTPVEVIDGDSPPVLDGQPYLKTQFRNGAFQKTLYTHSTLRARVGKDWLANLPE